VNRKNAKTIGKHGEVVEKPLYKCISKGLMHVAEWYHWTPKQSSRNSGNKFRLASPLTLPNFVALRQKAYEISVAGRCSWVGVQARDRRRQDYYRGSGHGPGKIKKKVWEKERQKHYSDTHIRGELRGRTPLFYLDPSLTILKATLIGCQEAKLFYCAQTLHFPVDFVP